MADDVLDWNQQLLDQLTWHWDNHARPRWEGLTDDEYVWEPAPGAWSIRRREEARTPHAAGALAALDDGYHRWVDGVRALDADGLARPVGPAEGPFAEYPFAALVLHINREAIHHLAEVLLLRDFYRHKEAP